MPPHIAGREREKSVFVEGIGELTRSEEPQAILLVGPRGCGKTVLLNWCRNHALQSGRHIRVKEFTREVPTTMAGIARELLDNVFDVRFPDEIVARANVGIAGAEGKWNTEPSDMAVLEALIEQCGKSPLLLVLEEAADKNPESVGALFNLHQRINRETGNMLFVLAGTPRVMDVLRDSKATFSDRNRVLNVGLLGSEKSAEAIAKPLRENRMSITEPALAKAVTESQGFPYFLQVWGKALFNRALGEGTGKISLSDVEAVTEEVDAERNVTYATRYREWSANDRKILAEVLASIRSLENSDGIGEDDLLQVVAKTLESHEESNARAEKFAAKITETGCLWQPWGSNKLESGLPSFIDFALDKSIERKHAV